VTEESDEIDRLVAAVVAGDQAALNQLLVILRPLIVRYCRSRLGTERGGVAADDVAQEVCVAVLKALPTYIDQGKPFLAFVYGIASHKVVDAHRHAGRDRSEPTDDVPESFADAVGPEQHALEMSASAEMRALLDESRGPDDTPPRAILDARRLSTRDAAGNRSARRGRA
jgi:RNA polymerase sigma-70 factor (ECF subfamily)